MATIEDFQPFVGEHCETNTTGNLLKHAGLDLSEPMLFGLGEGLAFGVFVFKGMPVPFVGGRPRPEEITRALAKNLGFQVNYRQTRSKAKAWDNIAEFVDANQPVGVKLNMRYLDYFTFGVDFAAHYVAVYGYDDESVSVVDTAPQGGSMRTAHRTFEEGRLWKGSMSSNALTWTVNVPRTEIEWQSVLVDAVVANAQTYLNPPIRNLGGQGIRKAAQLIPSWLDTIDDAPAGLALIGNLMERGGTGGGMFRAMYRDFLDEANQYVDSPNFATARNLFSEAAALWTEVSEKLISACADGPRRLQEVAGLMVRLADIEEEAMKGLAALRPTQ